MTTLRAPAKLTWSLEVLGQRADGYHLLRSEMVTLDLADTLRIEAGDALRVEGRGAFGVPVDESNLVRRALALCGRTADVLLTKAIPSGGGLGGGSADAAAVLRWAGFGDVAAAAALGGDVPFCLVGGRALVEGIGERLTPLAFEPRTVTLFLPDFGVNTAACYRAYDDGVTGGRRADGRNHLTAAAVRVEPRLGRLLAFVAATTSREAVLAGSGSSVFVEGRVDLPSTMTGPDGVVEVLVAETTPAEW
jgi:4-diphosphocytidyl-2-C-methyl-D-erythritol kinase